ncbi:DUF58 domain-containing protein [Cellulomonas hominis]
MQLRPTLRGTGVALTGVALAGAGVGLGTVDLVRIGTLPVLAVVCAAIALGALDPGRGRHRLRVARTTTPEPVHAGSQALVEVTVTADDASGRLRLAGLRLGEQASVELSGNRPLRARVTRSPGRIALSYTVHAARRGRWALGPLSVTRHDLFGVVRTSAVLGEATTVRVWPAVTRLPAAPEALVGEPDRVALGSRSPSPDDAALRGYRAGDDLRRVHWRSSARRGELVVRSDERTGRRPVAVLLDLPADPAALEWSISLAMSVALCFLDAGHPVRLVTTDPGDDPPEPGDRRDQRDQPDRHGQAPLGDTDRVHRGSGPIARAELLDRAIDLAASPSGIVAQQRLLDAAAALEALPAEGHLVVAVVGALTPAAAAALAPLAQTGRAWAVVHASSPAAEPAGSAQDTIVALARAGWRVHRADVGTDLTSTWLALLDPVR